MPNSIQKNILLVLASRFTVIIVRLVTIYLLTTVLGAYGFGIYSFLITILEIAALVGRVGFGYSNVFFISKSEIDVGNCVGNSFIVALINGVTIGLLLLLFPLIFRNMFSDISSIMMICFSCSIGFYILYNYITDIVNGLELFDMYYISFSLLWIVNGIFIVIFLLVGILNAETAFISFTLAIIVSLLLILYCLRKKLKMTIKISFKDISKQIKYGFPLYIRDFFNEVNFRFIYLVIKQYFNSSILGIYSLAVQAAEVLLYIPRASFTVLFPKFSNYNGNKVHLLKKSLRIFALIFGLILVLSYLFVPIIIKNFLPPEFVDSIIVFRILLIGIFCLGILNIIESYLLGEYRQKITMLSSGISAILLLVGSLLLVPKRGYIFAAIITSIIYVFYLSLTLILLIINNQKKKNRITIGNGIKVD